MPYLNLTGGEPWAETWGVMLFPDNEAKRRAFVAGLWLGFYPAYEKSGTGEAVPRSVLLSVMEAAATVAVERDEIANRRYRGLAAGDQLKVLFALAQTQSKHASWKRRSTARRMAERQKPSVSVSRAQRISASDPSLGGVYPARPAMSCR